MTIQQTEILLQEKPLLHTFLKKLIRESISTKKTSIRKDTHIEEHAFLSGFKVFEHETSDIFILDYRSFLVSRVVLEIAEETLNQKTPIDITQSLRFADNFCEEIRRPKTNQHWYGSLNSGLECYIMAYLHQVSNIDITDFLYTITDDVKNEIDELRTFDSVYCHSFPYLNDTAEKSFTAVKYLTGNFNSHDLIITTLNELGKINLNKASELYEFAKQNDAVLMPDVLPNLLVGLFPSNEPHYYKESIELFRQVSTEGILALSFIPYTKAEIISESFQFVSEQPSDEIAFKRSLPAFYTRLIENKYCNEDTRKQCFQKLTELTTDQDETLRGNLLWRTEVINGYDEDKMELLPHFMQWGQPQILNRFFSRFKEPAYLFRMLRQAYLQYGMNVNFELFKNAFSDLQHNNPDKFEEELCSLLTDDIAIFRFAGLEVLFSRYGGRYDIDFLKLNEDKQLRVIETLLPRPLNIESLLPLILPLRKSTYDRVRSLLFQELAKLINAYDYHIIELTEAGLDNSIEIDKQLLEHLKNEHESYKKVQEFRNSVKEFDPNENELSLLELYFRLERQQQAEMMEKVQGQGFFAQMAKNITVLRGSGFSSERNREISMMGKFSKSILIDRRYSIDPESYEWHFKMNAISNNYPQESQR